MIPRTYPSTYASNGQQQMLVSFLTDVTGLQRWLDYIPVKLSEGGTENNYNSAGYIDVAVVNVTSTSIPFKDYVPVYVDTAATDAWQVNSVGYIPYSYALFGDANMFLDLTNGASLDSRITFTRASNATVTGPDGTLQTVSTNESRFDYDPVTLEPKGLLIEEQRTNLLTYSSEFDNAVWLKTAATITANSVVAPDGTSTMDKLVETTANSTHEIQISGLTITSGVQYALSVYAKAAERTVLEFAGLGLTAQGFTPRFDLVSGTVSNAPAGATIVAIGNDIYRCTVVVTASVNAAPFFRLSNGSASVYAGDGTSGLYIWGAQLEAGAFATSYIPTTTAAATRAADVAVMTGANFSNWYRQDEGTVYLQGSTIDAETPTSQVFLNVGSASDGHQIYIQLTDGILTGFTNVASATQAQRQLVNLSDGPQSFAAAYAYKVNDFAGVANGGAVQTDTSGTIPIVSAAYIGNRADGVRAINGHIRRLAYFPRRLSNAELQAITA